MNCALWSAEVYEDIDGSLQNIKEAYSRGKMLVGYHSTHKSHVMCLTGVKKYPQEFQSIIQTPSEGVSIWLLQ